MPITSNLSRFSSQTLNLLEPKIHSSIKDTLGFSEPTLLQSAMNAIQEGGSAEEIRKRISSTLEGRKATKLAQKIFLTVDEFCIEHDLPRMNPDDNSHDRKRHLGDDKDELSTSKKTKTDSNDMSNIMTTDQIREMMANARKEILQRKAQLSGLKEENEKKASAVVGPQKPQPTVQTQMSSTPAVDDKAKVLADLQVQIASRMSKISDKLPVPSKPVPVVLDAKGRTVDASGQEIQLAQHVPTLKANLRAKKRDELKEQQNESTALESKYFDGRVTGKSAARPKRSFKFNEPGKFQMEGQRMRMKAQLEKLQSEISTNARKTGITSATQLAKLVPKDAQRGRVPDVEWWDAHIMDANSNYDDPVIRQAAITNLIEHPIQMMPMEPTTQPQIEVFLTKKERKKLRRQNRREAWKEKQDKIRIGLIPPDEPKVKMSNLMRVLGNEAIQDPTKVEAHVRAQMAKRLANHEKANAKRKLTPDQRKEKLMKKLKEDTSYGVSVAVYRVKNLSNPSKRFKVETNAKQLHMTGCVVMYEDLNVVVVEGGPKQQKKYKQLMLNRIKWDDETYKDKDGLETDNKCALVWEGQAKERNFGEIRVKQCPTESFARDFFKKMGVEHYWDQAYSGAVLEATEDM